LEDVLEELYDGKMAFLKLFIVESEERGPALCLDLGLVNENVYNQMQPIAYERPSPGEDATISV
jgi:hypothetical protein